MDWWIATQWEEYPTHHPYKYGKAQNGGNIKSHKYRALTGSELKEMWIVRYADDFKIFCRKRSYADKIFIAVKQWLRNRLKLEISEEKSKVVNLKNNYSKFLGIKMKAVKKRNKYVVKSHMCEKAKKKVRKELKDQIKKIQSPSGKK